MPSPRSRTISACERQVKTYLVVVLAAVILSGMYDPYRAPLAAAAVLVCCYCAWMWRVLPRMERSDEALSLKESMTTQARAHGPVVLWTLEIASIIFVISGIAMLVFDPASRLTGLFCTAFFGLCAAKIARLLVLRRRMAARGHSCQRWKSPLFRLVLLGSCGCMRHKF